MQKSTAHRRRLAHAILLGSVAAMPRAFAAPPATGAAAFPAPGPSISVSQPDIAPIWNDPGFRRAFIGSYGVASEVEPRVTTDDLALLELVRQLIGEDMDAARTLLAGSVGSDASAILDFTLGGILFQADHLDDALLRYRDAVAKFPSFRRAHRSIGLICTRMGRYDEAIAAFNRMIELGGSDAYCYGLLGYCHTQKQDYQPAEASYRNALLLQPDNVEWRLGLTRSVFKQGKYEDAASLLDVLIEAHPEKSEFWLLQAHTYLGLKQPMKAAVNLEALETLGRSTPDTLGTLGDIYLSENLPELALRAYARAVEVGPGQPPARTIRAAEALAARGAPSQARTLLEMVRATWKQGLEDAERKRVLKLEARLAMAAGGGDDQSAQLLEQVIELDPLDGDALLLLGQHFARKGEPDRAILFYERAARIDAFAPQAKVRMAQVYVAQSRFAEALPLLRDAQAARPREDVARYIEQVERAARAKR